MAGDFCGFPRILPTEKDSLGFPRIVAIIPLLSQCQSPSYERSNGDISCLRLERMHITAKQQFSKGRFSGRNTVYLHQFFLRRFIWQKQGQKAGLILAIMYKF